MTARGRAPGWAMERGAGGERLGCGGSIGAAVTTSPLGDKPAPPLPTDQDWINTSRPLTSEDVRGRLVILHFWTYA